MTWKKGGTGGGSSILPNQDALLKLGVSLNNRLTINGVEQTAGVPSAAKPFQGQTWRAYGDSITEITLSGNGYVPRVATDQGMTAINRGRSGWSIHGATGIADLLLADAPTDAKLITFTGGHNNGTSNLGTITDTTTATCYGSLNAVAQWVLTYAPNTKLVFMTPIQNGETTGTRLAGIKQVRQAIIDVGLKYSIPVLDWYAISGITLETSTKYLSDQVHPNAEGYRVMSAHLSKFISNLVV